ncbi:MAG: hypothetical protein ACKV0T_18485 [Planctomycetales bacterium]
MARVLSFCCPFLFFAMAVGVSHGALGDESPVQVLCPAISLEDYDEHGADVPASILPVALVVVGELDQETMTLRIQRTLFGPALSEVKLYLDRTTSRVGKSLTGQRTYSLSLIHHEWRPDPEQEGTLVRVPTSNARFTLSRYFESYRVHPVTDEPVLAALAQARLDWLVLGSTKIFVARPVDPVPHPAPDRSRLTERHSKIAPPRSSERTVKVERVLWGDQPRVVETVTVSGRFEPYQSASGSYIYFLRATNSGRGKPSDEVLHCWPDTEVPQVLATLPRRSLFPVRDGKQEIRFSGTVGEAIALLGSRLEPAQSLGARRLILDGEVALPEVSKLVEAHLFKQQPEELNGHSHLMRLISTLGLMEQHRTDGEVVRLIGLMLDQIQAGVPFPHVPGKPDKKTRNRSRYIPSDANHSLLWLLLSLEEEDAARLFGERLLDLRARAAYGWLEEIQECNDRGHLEDRMELAALRQKMATLTPARWSAASINGEPSSQGHSQSISQITFVDGATRLRTSSDDGVVCDWEATTGVLLDQKTGQELPAQTKLPKQGSASGRKLKFNESEFLSEDGTRWYSFQVKDAGGKYGPPESFSIAVSDVLAKSGRSPDDSDKIGPKRVLGIVELRWGMHEPFGLVPDGRHLHFSTQIFRRDDLKPVSAANVVGRIKRFQFIADGSKYVLQTDEEQVSRDVMPGVRRTRRPELVRVRLHDTFTGKTELAIERADVSPIHVAHSPDGRTLAIVDKNNTVEVWSIPQEESATR